MNLILEKFQKIKEKFNREREKEEGNIVMKKVIEIVNDLGQNFSKMDGGLLAEIQVKLAGYKFYLADYLTDLWKNSEMLKLEIDEISARRWEEITEVIKAEKGKVSNKEQIKNVLVVETYELQNEQILYEGMYYRYKMRISAIDDILTCIVQRIAELKRQIDQSKII